MTAATANNDQHVLVINRSFNAPRQLVWDVWNLPEHRENWFGPKEYRIRVVSSDFRDGGRWEEVMIGPNGEEFPYSGTYIEIVPIEKVVSTDEFDEELAASMPDLPTGMVVTILFADKGETTDVTINTAHATEEDKRKHEAMGVVEGWNSSFECLDEYLEKIQK